MGASESVFGHTIRTKERARNYPQNVLKTPSMKICLSVLLF